MFNGVSMMRWYGWVLVVLGVVFGGAALVMLALDDPELTATDANVIGSDLQVPAIGFSQVSNDYKWQFPQDFGPHPKFQREQWEIRAGEDCEFPFAVLFDRASFVASAFAPERESTWAMNGIIQAILTIDGDSAEERIETTLSSRMAVGLADADENHVWVEDWAWNWTEGTLTVVSDEAQLRLALTVENQPTPIAEMGWIAYRMTMRANGEIGFSDDQTTRFDCEVILSHRFGSQGE